MITNQDNQLLLLLKSDDEAAFTEIYQRYWRKLFVVVMHRLGNTEEAREIVQDIFCHLWNKRHSLQLDYSLNTYLSAAAKYEVINRLARKDRQQRLQNRLSQNWNEATENTDDQLQFHELQDQLATLVRALPEKCRIVFQLSRDKGYSQKMIASELGIAEKTVEAHLANALRKLRTGLSHLFFFLF
ncbi:RNA polymerase sigma-70 factor [Puia dinghuensis]|uniref:DNA-directed RNA polymerase sigma-70 factor n=1 Tax=Puia dinghuensis TaxID=1792502 RepID=A0A8J2XSX8_9BACT|nr:RNA polymerase sigma-70 factor [Puia dinghuensis]GGA98724.1 DNA-directed RNA polymerase sigma-70 factor [Puia dinghuensis]